MVEQCMQKSLTKWWSSACQITIGLDKIIPRVARVLKIIVRVGSGWPKRPRVGFWPDPSLVKTRACMQLSWHITKWMNEVNILTSFIWKLKAAAATHFFNLEVPSKGLVIFIFVYFFWPLHSSCNFWQHSRFWHTEFFTDKSIFVKRSQAPQLNKVKVGLKLK